MPSDRVLIVEDNIDSQNMLLWLLEHYEIGCDVCTSAAEALQQLAARPYRGLVVDLRLPDMDGWTLMNRVRTESADVQVVAVTAYHSPELRDKALKAGFDAYFAKPINGEAFIREIRRILAL
ncbi:MAG: response regulator [bacterium]|nr:response regulator [bacterium]